MSNCSRFWGAIEGYIARRSANTQRQYRAILTEWLSFCGSDEAAFVANHTNIWAWIHNQRSKKGQASRYNGSTQIAWSTIQRKCVILKAVYRQLQKVQLVEVNPFDDEEFTGNRHKSKPKRQTEAIEFADVARLLELPSPHTKQGQRDRCMLTLFFYAGLRRSEVASLRICDVHETHLGTVFVRLHDQKNQQQSDQALSDEGAQIVLKWAKIRRSEASQYAPLITHYTADREIATNERVDDKTLYRWFKKYCAQAGLPETFTPHSARATAITKMLSDGLSYREVQEFSRHSSIQMVEVYDKRHFSVERSPGKKLRFK